MSLAAKDPVLCVPVREPNGEVVYESAKDWATNPRRNCFVHNDRRRIVEVETPKPLVFIEEARPFTKADFDKLLAWGKSKGLGFIETGVGSNWIRVYRTGGDKCRDNNT